MWGGLTLEELLVAGITTLDIVVVYALLHVKKKKFTLIFWTVFLNVLLPYLGFLTGEMSSLLFTGWSTLLSSVLLGLIGLHMLLFEEDDKSLPEQFHPALIALAVSIDAFSISVSFGMLHMNKLLFITASGLFALVLSYVALSYKKFLKVKDGKVLRRIAGLALICIAVLSWLH